MSHEPRELVLLEQARHVLVEARTVDEVRDLQTRAELVRAYAKKARLGQEIVTEAAIIKLQADRRLGELLQSVPLAKAAPGNQYSQTDRSNGATGPVRLRDLGVTKSESSRVQRLAKLPRQLFDAYLERSRALGVEPTSAALLRMVERNRRDDVIDVSCSPTGDVVDRLQTLVEQGRQFSTIYADPPWGYDNTASRGAAENHYPTLSVEQICAEPVSEVCLPDAHLHLWTTNAFLFQAFRVMEAWGFFYKSCFVWVKPQIGIGNYWRVSHEFLLLGVRGQLAFRDNAQRSWLEHPRAQHSEKPEAIRQLVETVSPGPYLEMYGRRGPASNQWTVYGNDVVPRGVQENAGVEGHERRRLTESH